MQCTPNNYTILQVISGGIVFATYEKVRIEIRRGSGVVFACKHATCDTSGVVCMQRGNSWSLHERHGEHGLRQTSGH